MYYIYHVLYIPYRSCKYIRVELLSQCQFRLTDTSCRFVRMISFIFSRSTLLIIIRLWVQVTKLQSYRRGYSSNCNSWAAEMTPRKILRRWSMRWEPSLRWSRLLVWRYRTGCSDFILWVFFHDVVSLHFIASVLNQVDSYNRFSPLAM